MKIKYNIIRNEMEGPNINDVGEFKASKWERYELTDKFNEKLGEEYLFRTKSESEFRKHYKVITKDDWMVMMDMDHYEVINFVKA